MQDVKNRRRNADRREETRTALIAAARSLFAEKGYAETGTPEIVAAAQVTRGALYHHFADKAALFHAVVRQEARAVAEEIDETALAAADPVEALSQGAAAYFRAMTCPGRARLILLDGPAVLGIAAMQALDRETGGATLLEGLRAALPDRAIPNDQLILLADILSAAFDRAALCIIEGADPDAARQSLERLLQGLLRP